MYTSLDNYNQGLVVKDLGVFIQLAMSQAPNGSKIKSVEQSLGIEDDDDSIDGDTEAPTVEQLKLTNESTGNP